MEKVGAANNVQRPPPRMARLAPVRCHRTARRATSLPKDARSVIVKDVPLKTPSLYLNNKRERSQKAAVVNADANNNFNTNISNNNNSNSTINIAPPLYSRRPLR